MMFTTDGLDFLTNSANDPGNSGPLNFASAGVCWHPNTHPMISNLTTPRIKNWWIDFLFSFRMVSPFLKRIDPYLFIECTDVNKFLIVLR
jgi:hypothetical protein